MFDNFPHLPHTDHTMAAISNGACRFVGVGVDLHKQTITIAVVDGTRRLVSRKRRSNLQTDAIVAYLKAFMPLGLVVEATASYEWFVQRGSPGCRLGLSSLTPSGLWERGSRWEVNSKARA